MIAKTIERPTMHNTSNPRLNDQTLQQPLANHVLKHIMDEDKQFDVILSVPSCKFYEGTKAFHQFLEAAIIGKQKINMVENNDTVYYSPMIKNVVTTQLAAEDNVSLVRVTGNLDTYE